MVGSLETALEDRSATSAPEQNTSSNGTSGSFGEVLHLREHVARAAICSSGDWLDVSVAWVAKDREYFLVEAAAVEAAPRTRAETVAFRLLPGRYLGTGQKEFRGAVRSHDRIAYPPG